MPANIAYINGKVSMVYQGATPWHGLGKRLDSITSVEQAMREGGLDWRVNLSPMYYDVNGVRVQADDRKAVIRDTDSAYLGSVGASFAPLQNVDAFAPLADACQNHGCTIESAGALGNGSRVWMLAKLPTVISPVPGDDINGYFMVATGHDGSLSYHVRPTPIRVVCQNTLSLAIDKDRAAFWNLRHTSSIQARAEQVRKVVSRMLDAMKETGDTFTKLANQALTPQGVAEYIDSVFPADADGKVSDTIELRRHTVAQLVYNGKGAELAGSREDGTSTLWAVYNAVTEYVDHVRPAEAKSDSAKRSAMESALFGANFNLKLAALSKARELVAA